MLMKSKNIKNKKLTKNINVMKKEQFRTNLNNLWVINNYKNIIIIKICMHTNTMLVKIILEKTIIMNNYMENQLSMNHYKPPVS